MLYFLLNLVMLDIAWGVSTLNRVLNETKLGDGYLAMPCYLGSNMFAAVWTTNETSMSLRIFDSNGEALTNTYQFQGGTPNQASKQFNRGIAPFPNRLEFVFCREFQSSVLCSVVDHLGNEAKKVKLDDATFDRANTVSVATFRSGQFVVSWVDKNGAVQINMISQAGLVVRTKSIKSRKSPGLAILSSENFVLVCSKGSEDTEVNIFNSNLESIATIDLFGATNADVTGLEYGGFVVAWQQFDERGYGIFSKVYNNNGQQIVPKFQVNTFTNGDQVEVSIAQLTENQNYIVAVYQSDSSRDGQKVNYIKVFNLLGEVVTSEIELSGNYGLTQIAISGNIIFQATSLTNLTTTYTIQEFSEIYCIKFNQLSLSQIGDIDRINEEIAWEITKMSGYQLTCGIFIFDIEKNVKDIDLKQLTLPCKGGELINLRFIELDVCNDDMVLTQIECMPTSKNLEIEITPDSTVSKTSSCDTLSLSYDPCSQAPEAINGFCPKFDWTNTECIETEISESVSKYILNYDIVDTVCYPNYQQEQKASEAFFCNEGYYTPTPTCYQSLIAGLVLAIVLALI